MSLAGDLVKSGLQNLVCPSLNSFHQLFGATNDDPMFTLAQNYRFAVWMFPTPTLDETYKPNPLTALLGAKFLTSMLSGSVINPLNFLTLLARNAELPDFDVVGGEDSDSKIPTDFGYLTFPGRFFLPSDNKFKLTFMDTEFSPLDTFFTYWLAQTTSQIWVYDDRPYTTANFVIAPVGEIQSQTSWGVLPKQMYVFLRCFPSKIQAPNFDMEASDTANRFVEFKFSKMFVVPNITGVLETFTGLVS